MQKEYKTLKTDSTAKYEEKKSKFIAHAIPVSSEKEALKFIDSKKTEFWDATHNVFSYNVYEENLLMRSSDDGEPQGTAGPPVAEAISKAELQNIVLVVTRYFGGTQLGASGLLRAYGKVASMCLENAEVVNKILCNEVSVNFEYTSLGKLQNVMHIKDYEIKEIKYEKDVEMTVLVPVDEMVKFMDIVNEALNGKVNTKIGNETYRTVKVK